MKRLVKWLILLLVLAGGALYMFYFRPLWDASKTEYTYTVLKKGNIESNISCTGTLEAINTVQVGTQISGTVTKIHADYNDRVRAGQLLAEIDVRLLQSALTSAVANLSVMETRLSQTKEDFERNTALFDRKVITEKEFKDSKYLHEQALSNKKVAEAAVKSAEVNLHYARITSPINGTVTERSVEEGQTVAASFATPTLFIIAEDLSKMQILADVDESDIGYIHQGMDVRFTVQTYPGRNFSGTVSQIRLQPAKINNVVNYKVVVAVSNEDGLLLPGMTANMDFILEKAEDVLLLNNSALRFRPSQPLLEQLKPVIREKALTLPDSLSKVLIAAIENEEAYTEDGFRKYFPQKVKGLFYENGEGQVSFDLVEFGIATGLESEIVSFPAGPPLPAGSRIINGIKTK